MHLLNADKIPALYTKHSLLYILYYTHNTIDILYLNTLCKYIIHENK